MLKQLADIGKRLMSPSQQKDSLIKVLKQAATLLTEVEQSPSESTLTAMDGCTKALGLPALLKHKDKDVKLLVATCVSEIMRIVAPDAPYEDEILKDIFHLIVAIFQGLNDVSSPSFARRVNILETVAKVRSCVVMLDLECDDLILEMFHVFFNTACEEHPQNVFVAMRNILSLVLEESEEVSQPLLEAVLSNILKDNKDVSPAAHKLAVAVVERCSDKLEPYVQKFLTSVMLEGKRAENELQEDYHSIIFEIYRCAPQMLLAVIPNLTQELLTDQTEVRLKAVQLLGRLFALSGRHVAQEYKQLFAEFVKRFADKAVEVRLGVIKCAKTCLEANPAGPEATDILAGFNDRLLDFDDKVRMAVVKSLCDLVNTNSKWVPVEMIKRVSERLRDKKFTVRKDTLHKLAEVYRTYTTKCHEGSTGIDESFEWIPSKIVRCCYDKDFRPQSIEIVFSDELFGWELSVERRAKHWIAMFASFDKNDQKAFKNILAQKQRLQTEMQSYLGMRKKSKEDNSPESQKRIQASFKTIATSFVDSSKVEDNLQKLHQMKDNNVFKSLNVLLSPSTTFKQARACREDLLKRIGEKHPQHDFIKILATKCSFLLFNREHVKEVLKDLTENIKLGNKDSVTASLSLLVEFATFFPPLLEGTEGDLLELLKESDESIKEGVAHVLAKAGGSIRDQIATKESGVDLTLEQLCLEGSRRQAKHAVSAIAAISADSGLKALSVLYGRLVDLLEDKSHLPTILQSLGCIAENAIPIFETREEDVVRFVIRNLLKRESVQREGWKLDWDNPSEECLFKIYGVKCLVKSFIPHKDANLRTAKLKGLIQVLAKLIITGDVADEMKSSEIDRSNVRLAAGKAVLRLARRWDSHIPPNVVLSTILLAHDPSIEVRQRILLKVQKYLKERAIHAKYACVFALVAVDSSKDIAASGKRFLADFVDTSRREARSKQVSLSAQIEGTTIALHPEYVLTYLVHILAHQPQFPSEASPDALAYESVYRQLLAFLSALVHQDGDGRSDPGKKDDVENLPAILATFRAIKNAEDIVDSQNSEKVYAVCDIGIVITKELGKKKHFSGEYPGVIPLPSGLYKAIGAGVEEESLPVKMDGSHLPECLSDNEVFARWRTVAGTTRAGQPSSPRGNKREKRNLEATSSDEGEKDDNDPPSKKSRHIDEGITDQVKGDDENPVGPVIKQARGRKKANLDSEKNGIMKTVDDSKVDEDAVSQQRKRGRPRVVGSKGTTSGDLSEDSASMARKQEHSIDKGKGKTLVVENTATKKARLDSPKGVRDVVKKNPVRGPKPSNEDPVSDPPKKNPSRGSKEDHVKPAVIVSSGREKRSAEATRSPIATALKSNLKQGVQAAEKTLASKNQNGLQEDELIGCKIKVWWPIDKKFYKGAITAYDAKKNKHKVLYDDGEIENLVLETEKWEIVDSSQAVKKLALEKASVVLPSSQQSGKLKRKAGVQAVNNGSQSSGPSDKKRAIVKGGKGTSAQTLQGVGRGLAQAKSGSVSTPTPKIAKSSTSISDGPYAFHEDDAPSSEKGGQKGKGAVGEPISKGSGMAMRIKRVGETKAHVAIEKEKEKPSEKMRGKTVEKQEKTKLTEKVSAVKDKKVEKKLEKPEGEKAKEKKVEKVESEKAKGKMKGTADGESVKDKTRNEKEKDKVEIEVSKGKLEIDKSKEDVDTIKLKSDNAKVKGKGSSEVAKSMEDSEKSRKLKETDKSKEKAATEKLKEMVDSEESKEVTENEKSSDVRVIPEKSEVGVDVERARRPVQGEKSKGKGDTEVAKVTSTEEKIDSETAKGKELAKESIMANEAECPSKIADNGETVIAEQTEMDVRKGNDDVNSGKGPQVSDASTKEVLPSERDVKATHNGDSKKEDLEDPKTVTVGSKKVEDDEPSETWRSRRRKH